MKKLFLLTKTLLVAALLCVGASNAWGEAGDVTTNVDIDFSSSITGTNPYTISGTVGSMTWTSQWSMTPNITDGILRFGNFSGGEVELQNNTIGSKDVVTISFDLAFGKLNGKHVGFKFVDTEGTDILTQWFDAYNGDFDDSNPLGLNWDEMFRGNNTVIQERCVYFTITIDYDKKTIKTDTRCYLSGTGKAVTEGSHTVTLPSTTPIGKFVLLGNINNGDRYSTFDNLLIQTTEGDYSTPTAGYTIDWKCSGVTVKTDDSRSGSVGEAVTLLSTDKASFDVNDKRYIYVSDDASTSSIANDGSTVVTVTVREAEKWSYTVTTSYNSNTLAWSKSGSVWEDQNTIGFQIPRFQAYDGTTLVEAPYGTNGDLGKNITVTSDGFAYDYEYTATGITNLYLLSEAENLGTSLPTSGTTFTSRVSNANIIYGASGTLLTLPAGKYIFTLGAIGGDGTNHKVSHTVSAGETEIINGLCLANSLTLLTSEEFMLAESTDITFTCSDPASSRGIDLIYIQRTGDASVSKSITAAGWATYCSPYALDFSSSIANLTNAYIVTGASGEVLNTTSVIGGTIPANTGILLEGEGEVVIPVAASSSTNVSGNKLVGVTTSGVVLNANDGYVLMDSPSLGFYQNENNFTLTANTAYLPANFAAGGARAAYFFGGVTGVANVEAAAEAKAQEGKFIENGKLVIVKAGKKFNASGAQMK